MEHPDIERFRGKRWIPFFSYQKDELELDYNNDLKEDLVRLRNSFTTDRYPHQTYGFIPDNDIYGEWTRKMDGIDPTGDFTFADAFQPIYNEQSCRRIQIEKDRVCKVNKPKSCSIQDDRYTLIQKHNDLMDCRNIRAIESFSNCKSDEYGHWFKSNGIRHHDQMNKLLRAASECVDYYVNSDKKEQLKMKLADYHTLKTPKGYIKKTSRTTVKRDPRY